MEESNEPERVSNKVLLSYDNSLSSYGACRGTSTSDLAALDTPSRKHRFRLWTVTCSCMVAVQTWILFGYSIGYTAPVLNDLEELNSTYTSLRKTNYQDTFSVLLSVGGLVGSLVGGWVADYAGRKTSLVLFGIPSSLGWLMIVLTLITDGPAFRPLLYGGRLFIGFSIGYVSLCVPVFISEVSPSAIRGVFVAISSWATTVGIFSGQFIGNYITYYWLAIIPLGITCTFVLMMVMLKETPRWLISQGRKVEARSILIWLRGLEYDVDKELAETEEQLESEEKLSISELVEEFKKRSVYYPVLLAVIAMFFRQFSGIMAIMFYAEEIFKQAHIQSPGFTAPLATSGVEVITTSFIVILLDMVGRRLLLISSAVVMCLSLSSLGVYEFLINEPYCHPPDDSKCKDHLYPLAIASMAGYVLGFSLGWGAIPFLLASELIPLRVRGAGVGIATCVNWIGAIIVTGTFKDYEKAVKPWGVLWTFSLICFLSIIFVVVFIPETKGRSLEQIESYFKSTSKPKKRLQLN